MDDDNSAITIESYRLKLASPSDFIKSLKRTVNHDLRTNRIPLNFEFGIKDNEGEFVNNSSYWLIGKNIYTIHVKGIRKPILQLIVFNINHKHWYRYQVLINNPKPKTDLAVLLSIINTIFSDYLIEGHSSSSINFIPLPKGHQLTIPDPIVIKPKHVLIPFGIGFSYSLLTNFVLWPRYALFYVFVALTFVIYNIASKRS
jgi:hypothetical protein